MKIIFFLALLANLIFFLWQYNAGAFHSAEDNLELATPKTKQIWLLSELKKAPPVSVVAIQNPSTPTKPSTPIAVAVIAQPIKNNPAPLLSSPTVNTAQTPSTTQAPKAVTTAINPTFCYQIGGFTNKEAVTHWIEQALSPAALQQIHETQPAVIDYLVYYSATAKPQNSTSNIANLKAHGINDFFMINYGEFKGAISLGVFKNQARAIKAQNVLIQKGIQAQVGKRYKTPPSVFAQIKTEKNKPQLLATLSGITPQPRVELLSKCD